MREIRVERKLTRSQDDNGHGVRVNGPEARDPQTAEMIKQGDAVELPIPGHVPLVADGVIICVVDGDLVLLDA